MTSPSWQFTSTVGPCRKLRVQVPSLRACLRAALFSDYIEFQQRSLKIEVADGCAQCIQMSLVDNTRDYSLQTAECFFGVPIACIE